MLVKAFARRQMAQRVRPQVEAEEMARRHLAASVLRIVGGGLVPVAVGGEAGVAAVFSAANHRAPGVARPRQIMRAVFACALAPLCRSIE